MKTQTAIVGLGQTGLSVARFFQARKESFCLVDSREAPPGLAEFRRDFASVSLQLGQDFDRIDWSDVARIVLSPGVDPSQPVFQRLAKAGVEIIGDIELFCRETKVPIVAITGSNAKGTVTTLVHRMAERAGIRSVLGGNIGIPVLDLLNDPEPPEYYILELSSFQLETTHTLAAIVAVILNVSPDHLDRYETMPRYIAAKQRIYDRAESVIYNRDDVATFPRSIGVRRNTSFGLQITREEDYGILEDQGIAWLGRGAERLLPVSALKIRGIHNALNALAALAIAEALDWPLAPCLCALQEFPGLPHRCEWVACIDGVDWVNDSKATNVGATIAAIVGLGEGLKGKIILIAGGQGKGQDFTMLREAVSRCVKRVILFGEDARILGEALAGFSTLEYVADLKAAITQARLAAVPQDLVLLAPACASYDMFRDFEDRGCQFVAQLRALET